MLSKINSVQYLNITEEQSDQRIDNFLYALFNRQIPRAFIYGLIRTGQVRVNSGRIKPGYHLNIKDLLRIPPIKFTPKPEDVNVIKKPNKQYLDFWQKKLSKAIIFEDENLLIINKPAKIAVHGGSKVTIGLIEILRNLRPDDHFLELVHRIDQDTSGCLMVAKKRSYLKKLHTLLREQKITKVYSAVVCGAFPKKKIVELSLKKIIKSSKEHFVKIDPNGSYAKTEFILEKTFNIVDYLNNLKQQKSQPQSSNLNNQQYSLIIAKPSTGKTHQIRVHLAHIGFPIVNDDKYGHREYNLTDKTFWPERMFLHAKSLRFVCPTKDTIISVNADYDKDLINFLAKLEQMSG